MNDRACDPLKDFLGSYRELKCEAERLRRRITELETQCEKITASYSGMPSGHGDSSGKMTWDALIATKDQLEQILTETLEQETAITQFIRKIPNTTYRQLLRLRYLEQFTFDKIGRKMRYDARHVRRLHGMALDEARRLWAETQEEV